jgi:DNA-binding response OmpR family regulator
MRILIIDDEKSLADTLTLILQNAGYEARAVCDGIAALSLIEAFVPDLVISDVAMPGMNGIEACGKIKCELPNCHIILFSGQAATDELMKDARGKGCEWELLAKPVHPRDLLARLSALRLLISQTAVR